MAEYIDLHKKDVYFENKLKKIEKDKELDPHNKEIILRYLRESQLGKTVRKGQKRQIGSGRNLQAASFLNNMAKNWFKNTPLDKVTEKQMEAFIMALNTGTIKTPKGKPYADETKANIKKFIRKFYKWLLGNNLQYPELVEWIDTSVKEAEVPAIPGIKSAVWEVVELIPKLRWKALVWTAFDSGFRLGEIINCRLKDITKGDDGIYSIYCRESKTKPRRVSLPYASDLLDRWVQQHPKKDSPEAQLWQTSRSSYYKLVVRYTKKALGQRYSVHQIRHTSATFWAPKLDRVTFCKRFGWSYHSKTPDRYIDFAQVAEKKVVEIAKAEQYDQLKKEMDDQRAMYASIKAQMDELKKMMNPKIDARAHQLNEEFDSLKK